MDHNKRDYAAGDYQLGFSSESTVGILVMGIDAIAGTVTVKCRPHGTTIAYAAIQVKKRVDDTMAAAADTPGLWEADVSGCDVQITVSNTVTLGFNLVSG